MERAAPGYGSVDLGFTRPIAIFNGAGRLRQSTLRKVFPAST